jgi:acetyl esterase/lipase
MRRLGLVLFVASSASGAEAVAPAAPPGAAPPARPYVAFAIHVVDSLHPADSSRLVMRLVDLFRSRGIVADFFLTRASAAAYARAAPKALERLTGSGMSVGYLVEPPHPLLRGGGALEPDDIVRTLRDHERYAPDPASGALDRSGRGGYEQVAELLGHRPAVVAIPSDDPRYRWAVRKVYAELGADRIVLSAATPRPPGAPVPDVNLFARSGACLRSWLPRDASYWPRLRPPRPDDPAFRESLADALAAWGPGNRVFVTSEVSEASFYLKGTAASRARKSSGVERRLRAYEAMIAYAVENAQVVDSNALLRLQRERCVGVPDDVEPVRDLEIGRRGARPLSAAVLRPRAGGLGPLPAVLYVHGGAWSSGSQGDLPPLAISLARRGFLVVGLEYRLMDEAAFPAQILDLQCALLELKRRAAELALDPERIGVWGESAGGHLAALLGTAAGTNAFGDEACAPGPTDRVAAVAAVGAPTRLSLLKGPLRASAEKLLGERPGGLDWASPLSYVSSDDAPFLLVHGEDDADVPPEHARLLAQALERVGVDAEAVLLRGLGHGAEHYPAEAEQAILRFFEARLQHPSAP